MARTADFNYNFSDRLIAHEPVAQRDNSRLMVLDRAKQSFEHKAFYDLIAYLKEGDLLVLNDTRVIPANLSGTKEAGGAQVEVLLSKPLGSGDLRFVCLVRPGKRLRVGSRVSFGDGVLTATVLDKLETGEQILEFEAQGDFWGIVNKLGQTPLPPYIDTSKVGNRESEIGNRYQTVYAKNDGASAAPTAGFHFTPELLAKLQAKGVEIVYLTLHAGLGTFQPVRAAKLEEHKMHAERYRVPRETIAAVGKADRVIAVGTTVARALESLDQGVFTAEPKDLQGETSLFIYPGYQFKTVDAMITNFHWPKSTLIMLVSAFAGREFVMQAYQEAMHNGYRFFSFGDAMLIQ